MKESEDFILRLRQEPGFDSASPAVRRLAIILKRLGRNYGFRCIGCQSVRVGENTTNELSKN